MLSFGNSRGRLATRINLASSPTDVVVTCETSPVVCVNLSLGPGY